MRSPTARASALVLALALAYGCSLAKSEGVKREAVLALLRQEAQGLKQDGEKVNPTLGVSATWNIESVEVKEQAGNETQPWTGTVRFRIESKMKEVDGSAVTQQFEKRFDYVYNTTLNRWIIQYVPPAPPAAKP
jgi:hypothetical protein